MTDKITASHLDMAAYIYIRQSTGHQVKHHHQGRQRQYDLADRARELGFTRVEVIDEDQGRTGSGLIERPGLPLFWPQCVAIRREPSLRWKHRDWHAITATGITSLTCALLPTP